METTMEPLPGGWSGRTFLATVAGERTVVRLYPEGPDRGGRPAEVDAALLRLVRGLVPVPEVLEVRPGGDGRPALLVTSFVPGVRGDELLPTLDGAGLERVGRALGTLAGTLAGMPTLRMGEYVDPELSPAPFDPVFADLPALVEARRPGLADWSTGEVESLDEVAHRAQVVLDAVGRTCLVHSDLNPKNVLLDPDSLAVTALVDWEYAHSGSPYTDLGNLLRFDREPRYEQGVLAGFLELRGGEPDEVRHAARCADLFALVELATREERNPVADRARAQLRAVAVDRDVHAFATGAGWTSVPRHA